jgi:DNA-binding transcriptional MerR regulator
VEKGPDAFRTISEVADDLDLPQHVLRFWESRFPQIRPLKRGGGRRYYRPDDVELLRGIRHLLYGEGYTIRGVQRILKEEGPRYVQAIWHDAEAEGLTAGRIGHDIHDYDDVDAGHPAVGHDERAGQGASRGALSGLFGLLPSRQREAKPEEPELPLLPALAPQPRPARAGETLRHEARAEPRLEPRIEPLRSEMPHPDAPHRRVEPLPELDEAEDEPFEERVAFPFRALPPEPSPETSYRPEYEPAPRPAVSPAGLRPIPMRPVDDGLALEDIQRLQAALYDLQECRRLLDAAREDG